VQGAPQYWLRMLDRWLSVVPFRIRPLLGLQSPPLSPERVVSVLFLQP
jgi:hypothetical protein